ncbi:MAG: hypothetical protein ABFS56_35320 [Pseudomonadota bacterium]
MILFFVPYGGLQPRIAKSFELMTTLTINLPNEKYVRLAKHRNLTLNTLKE